MKLQISWGTGIVIAFAIFMGVTVSTAVYLMNQDVNLVADDYYDQEIKYQQQIDRINRTNKLDEKNIIVFNGSAINVTIPESLIGRDLTGEIYFYRPSDKTSDIKIPLYPDTLGLQVIPVSSLEKGLWAVKVNWLTGDNEYYAEERIFIQ
ncbi:MAG: nitrogen fixation protein FixH [Ignavibacteriaceae bacterium]|nr:nitrogen fixation protein FixH [Ignavibacteriaceae bacterium]